ncbi:hypothetical protein ACFFQW_46375 [Umezawaea endophytica]|uniref:Uncharacterized protein n=1 Tax=Umezawaea endophytica TaxID=1654476 RepID=A0A9X3AL20_9PSEU|nr:hypothetical protein [Umezawaea endophytica]MCS7483765.1 hypothetical protein [Umezawaea endophytica]
MDARVTEMRSLGAQAEPLIQAQRDDVGEWVRLCVTTPRELDEPRAQIEVQAVLMAVDEIARGRTLSQAPVIDVAPAELVITALITPSAKGSRNTG